jgi:Protein of unknown function (DUF1579)
MLKRSILVVGVLLFLGCAPRTPTDALGVKPQHLTPEEWVVLSQPGERHELLNAFVGEWDVDIVSWRDPKANPERSKGHSSSTWILGYRYVREKFVSLELGPRYEGLGFLGYDAGAKLFTTVWLDSLNTSIATSKGLYNPGTSTLEFRGEIYDPLLGRTKETRTFIRVLSKDSYEVSLVDRTARGIEFQSLQMTYRRIPQQDSHPKNGKQAG